MKTLFAVLLILTASLCWAQTPTLPDNVYFAGPTYNPGASPAVAGTAGWAHKLSDSGTYSLTVVDVLPVAKSPFNVTTSIGAGVMQRIATIGRVPLFASTAAGIQIQGQNVGWSWQAAGAAAVTLKNDWKLLLGARVMRQMAGNDAIYKVAPTVAIAWGQ